MFFKTKKEDPKIRKDYKESFPFCQKCFKGKDIVPLDVHHIFPARAQMKIDHFLNFLSLCRGCHIWIEGLDYQRKVITGLNLKQGY